MAGRITWNLWFTISVLVFGLLTAAAIAVLVLSLTGRFLLPV